MASVPANDTEKPAKSGLGITLAHPIVIALATALVTQFSTISNTIWSWVNNTGGRSEAESKDQLAHFLRNPGCDAGTAMWHPTTGAAKIDATICEGTGDILVVMKDRDGHSQRWWPPLDYLRKQLRQHDESASAGSFLESAAHASVVTTLDPRPAPPVRATRVEFADAVLCQVQLDARTIKRRYRSGNGCIDTYIDAYTGATIKTVPVPCDPSCK